MNTRIDRTSSHLTSLLILGLAGALALAGCGSSKGGGSDSVIEFTPGAMKSVPSVTPSSSTGMVAAIAPVAAAASTIGDYFFVKQLFSMQCRHPNWGGINYCPPGTPVPPAAPAMDPYQFTMQSLIGFIFHAQGYTSLVTSCTGEGLTPKTVTASLYAAHSTSGSPNPTRFVLDQFGTYTCRSSNVSSSSAETRVVSAVADGSYQTTLHTRYKYDAGNGGQTDFFQVDVTMDASNPTFLALNFASAEPFRSRLVLLVNLATHKFALKYYTPTQPGDPGLSWPAAHYAVAVGTGGFDLTTGTANAGHYYVDFLDEAMYGEQKVCVNNVGGGIEAGFTNCAGIPMTWSGGSSGVQSYLEVPAGAVTRLAPYLAVFNDSTTLGVSEAWQAVGDEDLYWPASLN
jgi:hypothetical protein